MKKILLLSFLSVLLFSCCEDEPETDGIKNRTVLVYIAGDNNLYSNAVGADVMGIMSDVNELESAWKDSYDGKVYVFLDHRRSDNPKLKPRLLEISYDNTVDVKSKVVKEYDVSVDGADSQVLSQVIADVRRLSPSYSYGLVLWSHATGWIPDGTPPMKTQPVQQTKGPDKTFGNSESTGREMDIWDLANALPNDIKFDFIAFDACYMASIEVAYQLRDKTKYVISSATESYAFGYPYALILPDMMSKNANVVNIASKTVEFYKGLSNYGLNSSTMSVADCSKLPALASAIKDVVNDGTTPILALSTIQDFSVNSYAKYDLFYDLGDFVNKTWSSSPNLSKFNTALNDAYIYKGNTDFIFGKRVVTHCGATTHIPQKKYPVMLDIYRTKFDWSKDSGLATVEF